MTTRLHGLPRRYASARSSPCAVKADAFPVGEIQELEGGKDPGHGSLKNVGADRMQEVGVEQGAHASEDASTGAALRPVLYLLAVIDGDRVKKIGRRTRTLSKKADCRRASAPPLVVLLIILRPTSRRTRGIRP